MTSFDFTARPPTDDEIEELGALVEERVHRLLVRRGLWEDDEDGGRPTDSDEEPPALADLYQASVTQRAGGGRRLRRVRVTMALEPGTRTGAKARTHGAFDLHAGVAVRAEDRERLEHLCRYLLRPPLGNERLRTVPGGDILLQLRHPWSDGTTDIRLSPTELIERLAALVPRPGTNSILYRGVSAANAKWRKRIVPASGPRRAASVGDAEDTSNHSWAELMRRGLDIDTLECPSDCGGRLRFVAHIEDPAVIRRILTHLDLRAEPLAPARGPPDQPELDLSA